MTPDLFPHVGSISTANLSDACDRLAIAPRHAALAPVVPGMRLVGTARTVRHRGSVDAFFSAMERAAAGEVLVIDNDGRLDEGCIGDLTVLEAKAYGMRGLVVFGAHRDTAELRNIGLPVFSLGACALGPRSTRDEADRHQVRVATCEVIDGDLVLGDDDGVIFVAAGDAAGLIEAAVAIREQEQRQAERVRAGTTLHEQFRWREYAERSRVDPEYTFRTHLKSIGCAIEE